jgi:hypothetical protein
MSADSRGSAIVAGRHEFLEQIDRSRLGTLVLAARAGQNGVEATWADTGKVTTVRSVIPVGDPRRSSKIIRWATPHSVAYNKCHLTYTAYGLLLHDPRISLVRLPVEVSNEKPSG